MSDEEPGLTPESPEEGALDSALSELIACETLAQTCAWAVRWCGEFAGAEAALLWTPDPAQPVFNCTGTWGDGTKTMHRRTVPRGSGLARELIRDKQILYLSEADLLVSEDPWIAPVAKEFAFCHAIPVEWEGTVIGLLALLSRAVPDDPHAAIESIGEFFPHAAQALGRSIKTDRKTNGMLHAIERLTNLYDLSKAFGSTIDWDELTAVIARKAVDFGNAEVASLWILEGDDGEISLASTAVNENYDVENAPGAVGSSIIGDIIVERSEIVENGLAPDHPLRQENDTYDIHSVLAVPLIEDDAPVGAIVVANKRGRHPQFSDADKELLNDLGHQAVRAVRNARRHRAEQKVEELDALLAVSREITSTLDLDRVMTTVVNSASALISFDRCAIAIMQKGKLQVGAISGMAELERGDPSVRRTAQILEWVFYAGHDVHVTRHEDGTIDTDRPETEEKFRTFFEESGMNSFHGVLIQDEEGKLGVLGFEAQEPLLLDSDSKDLLQILVNQATVALRNAQLYQQVPLMGFWKPILEKRRQLAELPISRLKRWAVGVLAAIILLVVVPWSIRLTGSATVVPNRRIAVTSPVDGVVVKVHKREGDFVPKGEILAQLATDPYEAALAEARSMLDIASSDAARAQAEGNTAALAEAAARRDEWQAKFAVAQNALQGTDVRAPASGVIVTPHLESRIGQFLRHETEFAEITDVRTAVVEVSIPEADSLLLKTGQPVKVKLNAFPSRSFSGTVTRLGAELHPEGEDRFLTAEMEIRNADSLIKAGMLGKAKVNTGARPLGYVLFRKPLRYFWAKVWPLLP